MDLKLVCVCLAGLKEAVTVEHLYQKIKARFLTSAGVGAGVGAGVKGPAEQWHDAILPLYISFFLFLEKR